MNRYETTLTELKRNIMAQKTIYRFRNFIYSVNRDVRENLFDICRNYLQNEYQNNELLTATERERLPLLINHWRWNEFETNAIRWWHQLSMNHSHSVSLMTLLHLWIDDIEIFDPEAFETSTIGLR